MNLDAVSVNAYGDMAVAFASQEEKSRYADADISGHYHYTNVWANKDGRWQAVASHGTRFDRGISKPSRSGEVVVRLPFTEAQFFDVLAAYNAALWPVAAVLWLLSLAAVRRMVFRRGSDADRDVSALLAVLWAWSAVSYHTVFFTRINPAAWLFAGLFGLQAGLFVWFGIVRGRLRFTIRRSLRHLAAALLVGYGLAYPFINLVLFEYPRVPTFGVPCPTAILTAGLLVAADATPLMLVIVPVIWSGIGASAAILFGVEADFMLLPAGILLIASAVARPGRSDQSSAPADENPRARLTGPRC